MSKYVVAIADLYNRELHLEIIEADSKYQAVLKHPNHPETLDEGCTTLNDLKEAYEENEGLLEVIQV